MLIKEIIAGKLFFPVSQQWLICINKAIIGPAIYDLGFIIHLSIYKHTGIPFHYEFKMGNDVLRKNWIL